MSLPDWYTTSVAWLVLIIGGCGLLGLALWSLDRAFTALFRYVGVWSVVTSAIYKHYRPARTQKGSDSK